MLYKKKRVISLYLENSKRSNTKFFCVKIDSQTFAINIFNGRWKETLEQYQHLIVQSGQQPDITLKCPSSAVYLGLYSRLQMKFNIEQIPPQLSSNSSKMTLQEYDLWRWPLSKWQFPKLRSQIPVKTIEYVAGG